MHRINLVKPQSLPPVDPVHPVVFSLNVLAFPSCLRVKDFRGFQTFSLNSTPHSTGFRPSPVSTQRVGNSIRSGASP